MEHKLLLDDILKKRNLLKTKRKKIVEYHGLILKQKLAIDDIEGIGKVEKAQCCKFILIKDCNDIICYI